MLAKFRPNYVEVTLDPEGVVVPVLERVRKLMDMEDAPGSRKGCRDCELVDAYGSLLASDDLTDSIPSYLDRKVRQRYEARARQLKLTDGGSMGSSVMSGLVHAADPYGALRNWDWSE